MSEDAISLFELQQKIAQTLKTPHLKTIWVRCEISEYNDRGHVYLDLTESKGGKIVAKQRATIWSSQKGFITDKFLKGSGTPLQKGIQVMFCGTIEHHPAFGLGFVISDIDPTFTVGQMQLKIQEIKNKLIANKCFSKNKELNLPTYFQKIAVLTPGGSAGEGDFKKDADKLESLGLCEFKYYNATMQGLQAEESMSKQIAQINRDHTQEKFEALVIIRGGGAVSDLSWLNNYKSALYICKSYFPVITGLGHERDICVLDEISNLNAGTPSKCIEHITKNNLKVIYKAKAVCDQIRTDFSNTISKHEKSFNQAKLEIKNIFFRKLLESFKKTCQFKNSISNALDLKISNSEKYRDTVENDFKSAFFYKLRLLKQANIEIHNKINKTFQSNINRSTSIVLEMKNNINKRLIFLPVNMFNYIQKINKDINNTFDRKIKASQSKCEDIKTAFSRQFFTSYTSAAINHFNKRKDINNNTIGLESKFFEQVKQLKQSIYLFHPMRILEKGYAIIRNEKNEIITNAEHANTQDNLIIDFKDHSIKVKTTGEQNDRITTDI